MCAEPRTPTVIAGGACTCEPGRMVRFAIPPGVRGCPAVISCRPVDSSDRKSVREHDFPKGGQFYIRCADING